MITEPTASSTEPTVLDVESVTAFVVFSACCDAQPGTTKSAPTTKRLGIIRFILNMRNSPIDELSLAMGESGRTVPASTHSLGWALRSKIKQRNLIREPGSNP